MGCGVVWCYFNNCSGTRKPAFAVSAIQFPIFHDVGATIPT